MQHNLKGRLKALESALLPSPPAPVLQVVFGVRPAVGEVETTNAQNDQPRLTGRAPGVYALPDGESADGGLWLHA